MITVIIIISSSSSSSSSSIIDAGASEAPEARVADDADGPQGIIIQYDIRVCYVMS